ncbi:hypothetical protein M1P56_32570 [Streptomyces sp. HU2014]|uniref:hypothetical protein n=1 Tax=Streptomyces sp. HU2014 TaxID=2939414 RepID=UPI00200DEE9D|nr:hypothetical protein [Streptomyces sp. HU2014]UQI48714.1 hypothetical protein M1P56_32570 [Streptomyces sp. HU2014]
MDAREDFDRTIDLICSLAVYAHVPFHDEQFVAVVGPSLVASLPEPPIGTFPPGYDPNEGPDYPGQGW